jgi:hypothetical protein
VLENALLRQQLIALQRQGKYPTLTWRDRALYVLLASKLPSWKTTLMIIQPDTLLRWHRDLFRRVWKRKSKRVGKGSRQQLREATPFGESPRFLIRDNADKLGDAFARVADGSGTEVLTTPYQAPKANSVCERFLGGVRRECLDFYLILSERHLYRTMKQYHAYFNHARPHKGINQHIPCPPEQSEEKAIRGWIICQPVHGGLHHDYHRRTAPRPSLALPECQGRDSFLPLRLSYTTEYNELAFPGASGRSEA